MKKTNNHISLVLVPMYQPTEYCKNIPYLDDYNPMQTLEIWGRDCIASLEGDNVIVLQHKQYDFLTYKYAVGVTTEVTYSKKQDRDTQLRQHAIVHNTYRTKLLAMVRRINAQGWA